jgi:hypothetical protein
MNKFTPKLYAVSRFLIQLANDLAKFCADYCPGLSKRKAHGPGHGPRWQQLELPLSRTPVKRWHR